MHPLLIIDLFITDTLAGHSLQLTCQTPASDSRCALGAEWRGTPSGGRAEGDRGTEQSRTVGLSPVVSYYSP